MNEQMILSKGHTPGQVTTIKQVTLGTGQPQATDMSLHEADHIVEQKKTLKKTTFITYQTVIFVYIITLNGLSTGFYSPLNCKLMYKNTEAQLMD